MKNEDWEPKRRTEVNYRGSLKKLFKRIELTIKGIKDPFKIIEVLKKVPHSEEFNEHAKNISKNMAKSVHREGAMNWRQAASQSNQGNMIYESLQNELDGEVGRVFNEIIENNSKLITSVPDDIAEAISKYVAKESLKGRRSESIAKDLQEKFPLLTKQKAELIARTEASKATTALSEARGRQLGVKWYVWKTSKDARVRSSHQHMDGVLISWDDPPSPEALIGEDSQGEYHAGCTFNCRCYPANVVTLLRMKFPVKVYYQGKIQSMNKSEFEKLM